MGLKVGNIYEHKQLAKLVQVIDIIDVGGEEVLILDLRLGETEIFDFQDLEAYRLYKQEQAIAEVETGYRVVKPTSRAN